MKRILLLMSALAVFFACTPEKQPSNSGNNGDDDTDLVEIYDSFTATLNGSTIKTTWEEDDEIRVICVDQENLDKETVYTLSAGAGTGTGTFVPKEGAKGLEKGGIGYFAVYPANQDLTFAMHNTFAVTVPAEQTAPSYIFSYAADASTLNFASLLGALKISFTGKGNIGAVTVADKKMNNILFGNTTINLKTNRFEMRNGAATKNTVTHKLAAAAELSETVPTSFVIEVPANTLAEGAEITLLDLNGLPVAKQDIEGQTIKVGEITDAGTFVAKTIKATFDLSTTAGAANSYIVPDSGKYKFPAVKGNDASQQLEGAATAELLWETYCDDTDVTPNTLVMELSYANYSVTFETPETYKEGNAVVCVKDANGNVLWAWHLWFTKATIPTIPYGSIELMDRNLGALGNTPEDGCKAFGLFYQWGRPMPFVGVVDPFASEIVPVKTAPVYEEAFTKEKVSSDAYKTPEYGIANPTVFLYGKYCWYSPFDQQLWAAAKTIYDPCPPGYKVPEDSSSLWDKDSAELVAGKGYKFNGAWYPFAGFWKYSGSWYASGPTYMFTATMQNNESQGGYINAQIIKYHSDGTNQRSYDRKAALCNVRCEKISDN